MVAISWRSTAAAPRLPPPAARIARPAAFMSSEIEMVLRVALAGGAGAVDELAVRRRGPGARRGCRAAPTSPPGPCRSRAASAPSPGRRRCARSGRPWRGRGPSETTRRSCSAGSSSTNAGWETPTIAVRVAACGSWTMTAPVSGSTHCRSRAASPGSASVPAGRGFTIRRRYSSCPPVERQSHRAPIGAHSMSLRPPTPTNASATKSRMIGKVITTAPTYRPRIKVPDARLGHHELRSGQAEQYAAPGQAGELDRASAPVRRSSMCSRPITSVPAVSASVESATGGGTVEGAADSCASACPVACAATKLPSRGPAAAASFATTTPAATAPPAAAAPPEAPPAPAPPPPAPLDGPPADGPAVTGELPDVVPPPPPPPPLSPRTLAGSLPVRRRERDRHRPVERRLGLLLGRHRVVHVEAHEG